MATNKFTPLHLTILLTVFTGSKTGYAVTDTSNGYEEDLVRQGLLYRNAIGYIQITEYGKAKTQELLLRLHTPKQFYTENPNG